VSQSEEVAEAYERGHAEGNQAGKKAGMLAAYLDTQKFALERLTTAPPYTDTRVASEMVDFVNARLLLLNDGTAEGSLAVITPEAAEVATEIAALSGVSYGQAVDALRGILAPRVKVRESEGGA
jgi:flagellar biosynthesis/type III secretory pathway protein FliH